MKGEKCKKKCQSKRKFSNAKFAADIFFTNHSQPEPVKSQGDEIKRGNKKCSVPRETHSWPLRKPACNPFKTLRHLGCRWKHSNSLYRPETSLPESYQKGEGKRGISRAREVRGESAEHCMTKRKRRREAPVAWLFSVSPSRPHIKGTL